MSDNPKKLTEDDIGIYDSIMGTEILGIDIHHSQEEYDQLKSQILKNQEIVERLERLINYNHQQYLENKLNDRDVWMAVLLRDWIMKGYDELLDDDLKRSLTLQS